MFTKKNNNKSNVQIMQLFHEIKQQFPTVSDHVITSAITSQLFSNTKKDNCIDDISKVVNKSENYHQELMGRPASLGPLNSSFPAEQEAADNSRNNSTIILNRIVDILNSNGHLLNNSSDRECDMNKKTESEKYIVSTPGCRVNSLNQDGSHSASQRPNNLDIRSNVPAVRPTNLNLKSENFQKTNNFGENFLFSPHHLISDKPPKSPLTTKHTKDVNSNECDIKMSSPSSSKMKQTEENNNSAYRKSTTVETPTQTTDTLLGDTSLNFSVNFNCSLDYVDKSPVLRRTSQIQVTPSQPWLQQPNPQRNYTSVNLTLRPPSSEPQPPIDITSKNSSLTYSTSSFDSQKGLQSRLQITVGPSGSSVSSLRTRPKSYHSEEKLDSIMPPRTGSLPDLTKCDGVILKQQARIEKLHIELSSEKAKLVILKKEVDALEKESDYTDPSIDKQIEEQLLREIKHLKFQCEQLAEEMNRTNSGTTQEHFYHNIYTGQRPAHQFFRQTNSKWNCHLCTFLNHPDLNKCEQCEMARILHGNKATHTC